MPLSDQTQPARPPSARNAANLLTIAPITAKAAELLHALYADALSTAAESMDVPPVGAIVLPEARLHGLESRHRESHGYRRFTAHSANWDYEIDLQTPLVGDVDFEWNRPGIWYGSETRADQDGRHWRASLPVHYTTDDFGDLVPIGAAS